MILETRKSSDGTNTLSDDVLKRQRRLLLGSRYLQVTECLLFPNIFAKPVVAQFDQRQGSSDGGAAGQSCRPATGTDRALANCLVDQRQVGKIDHEMEELLRQRIFGIACGYADANDAARLAEDPVHKMLVGRDPIEDDDLASQPTLSRFENAVDRKQLYRMGEALAECVIERHRHRLHGRARADHH